MTEAGWLACEDPKRLLDELGRKVSLRKRRLFGCACCYRIMSLIPTEEGWTAVVAAEQFADGLIDADELKRRETAAYRSTPSAQRPRSIVCAINALSVASQHSTNLASTASSVIGARKWQVAEQKGVTRDGPEFTAVTREAKAEESAQLTALLHDIVGNPFRKVKGKKNWRTDTAVSLARQMYESREFGAMPILADALQDAGCDNDDILSHCRGAGPHVRGCWVVDLVLGKE